jgi:hypothetical protein
MTRKLKFSIATLLVLMALAGVSISHLRTSQELRVTKSDNRWLRNELGDRTGVAETYYPREPSERECAQREAANAALMANHYHFNGGKQVDVGRLALNNDAFDFMIGRPTSDFPSVFSVAETFTQARAKTYSNGEHMVPWMDTLRSPFGTSELVFYHLYTTIGLTYGYESQKDDLLIAVNAGKIVAWRFFPLTLY